MRRRSLAENFSELADQPYCLPPPIEASQHGCDLPPQRKPSRCTPCGLILRPIRRAGVSKRGGGADPRRGRNSLHGAVASIRSAQHGQEQTAPPLQPNIAVKAKNTTCG